MSNGILEGKRGLVFGVANERSIAWACAQECARQGAQLGFSYLGDALKRRVEKLVETDLPNSLVFPCDVSRDEDIDAAFESVRSTWDTLDFVIHSVAFAKRENLSLPFVETPREDFALALDISAYSLVAIAQRAMGMMPNGGSIISMTYYGAEKVVPNYNVMGVAKAALEACTRYLAYGLGSKGIRVNTISAGPIRTLSSSAISDMKVMLDVAEKAAPLQRNVTQEDIGRTAVYLLSELSSGVTGETLHVDCGYNVMGLFGYRG